MGLSWCCMKSDSVIDLRQQMSMLLMSDYHLGPIIGHGSFGIVRLATSKVNGGQVAVKIIDKTKLIGIDLDCLKREIEILRGLNHPNIVRFYRMVEDENTCFIIMEYAPGGELLNRLIKKSHLNEAEARSIIWGLLAAVEYLHKHNVVHRDLKPENILLSSEDDSTAIVKVADFGLASLITKNSYLRTACGSYAYTAPEIINNEPYDKKVDLWAIGVITYALLGGYLPFGDDENTPSLMRKISRVEYEFHFEYWSNVSDRAKDLIKRLLVRNPKQRLSASDACLHPWFSEDPKLLRRNSLNSSLQLIRETSGGYTALLAAAAGNSGLTHTLHAVTTVNPFQLGRVISNNNSQNQQEQSSDDGSFSSSSAAAADINILVNTALKNTAFGATITAAAAGGHVGGHLHASSSGVDVFGLSTTLSTSGGDGADAALFSYSTPRSSGNYTGITTPTATATPTAGMSPRTKIRFGSRPTSLVRTTAAAGSTGTGTEASFAYPPMPIPTFFPTTPRKASKNHNNTHPTPNASNVIVKPNFQPIKSEVTGSPLWMGKQPPSGAEAGSGLLLGLSGSLSLPPPGSRIGGGVCTGGIYQVNGDDGGEDDEDDDDDEACSYQTADTGRSAGFNS